MSWLKNAVIYQVFIDRFAGYAEQADDREPHFVGGNIKGVTAKIPYLVDLGIDAVWLTPFFKTTDYHGYSTLDFYSVDPHFGTLGDLKAMVAACHQAGIKVIIDFTANHTSSQHPFFLDALGNPASAYRQWYYFDRRNRYLGFLDFTSLPKLNLDYQPARDHVIGAAEYWAKELGIDGFRLDHVIGPSDDFWREFKTRIKAIDPEIVLLGEAVLSHIKWRHFRTFKATNAWLYYLESHLANHSHTPIMRHYIGLLDGCLDYAFKRKLDAYTAGKITKSELVKRLAWHYGQFPDDFALPAFLDNHDSNRYLYDVGNDYGRLKSALEFEFAQAQPTVIYYGDEVGMTQEQPMYINTGWAGDLPARRKMNWHPNQQEQALLEFYKDLISCSKPSG